MASLTPRFEKGNQMPIGTSIQSMLTEAQFQAANGSGWILADGRSVSGSRYATLTGNSTVPDCRGEFIRGLDNGRGVDSGRVKGSAQANATAPNGLATVNGGAHIHSAAGYNSNASAGNGTYPASMNSHSATNMSISNMVDSGGTHSHSITGDSETRPRNIAMNIFIKIN